MTTHKILDTLFGKTYETAPSNKEKESKKEDVVVENKKEDKSPNEESSWDIEPSTPIQDNIEIKEKEKEEEDPWAIKPVEEDLLDDDYARESEAGDVLDNLLAPSKETIKEIVTYLEEKIVPYTSTREEAQAQVQNPEQIFTIEGKSYILHHEEVKWIYLKILDLNNQATLNHALKRRPTTMQYLLNEVKEEHKTFTHPVLEGIPYKVIVKLIIRVLSLMTNNALMKQGAVSKLRFNMNQFAQQIGETILDTYINLKYIYKDIKDPELHKEDKSNKHKIYEFEKEPDTVIKEHLIELEKQTKISPLNTIIINYTNVYILKTTTLTNEIESTLKKYYISIGVVIIEWLLSIGLFKKESTNKQVPELKLIKQLDIDLIAAASYNKPHITKRDIPTLCKINRGDHIDISINIERGLISSKSTTEIRAYPELYDIIKEYNTMEMSINKQQVEDFFQLLKQQYAIQDKNNPLTLAFLKMLYNIDFNLLLQNNTDLSLVEDLIAWGTNLKQFFSESLLTRSLGNLACNNAYNTLSSYKYYIKGLLNDLNIYKHLDHFYIPKYVSSTGRMFSNSFFLQLQGNKLARAFITFKQQTTLDEDNDYTKINTIYNTKYPLSPLPHTIANQTRGLFNSFVKSLCKDNTDLKTYPFHNSVNDRLLWLSLHCNKPFDILFLKSLDSFNYLNILLEMPLPLYWC